MNIFEELIGELKEEHLLETTVTNQNKSHLKNNKYASENIIEVQTALENNETAQVFTKILILRLRRALPRSMKMRKSKCWL